MNKCINIERCFSCRFIRYDITLIFIENYSIPTNRVLSALELVEYVFEHIHTAEAQTWYCYRTYNFFLSFHSFFHIVPLLRSCTHQIIFGLVSRSRVHCILNLYAIHFEHESYFKLIINHTKKKHCEPIENEKMTFAGHTLKFFSFV